MPPFGSTQPQTLAYRVEIDQSSLSDVVSNIQTAIGNAMSTAMASVQGLAQGGQASIATAMGSPGAGNLAFMDQMRARILTQPTAAGAAPTVTQVIMAVPGAVAAKAGFVDAGFSQTQGGMMEAATKTLRDARATIPEMFSKGMHFTAGVMDWAGTAAGVIGTGAGWMGATGIAAAAGPIGWAAAAIGASISVSMIGVDRMNEQDAMRRSLMRFGDGPARSMVRELEDQTRSMRGIGFDEATQVARSALMNVGPQTLSTAGASQVIRESIQDWRMIGKTWGVGKDEALDVSGQAYRLGIAPGGMTSFVGNVRSGADALGVSTSALGDRSFQFAQASMGLGYDALASANQFAIQTAMVGEASRSGTVTRGQMALMSGFSGPVADQAVAIAQQHVASMRALQVSDFGRLAQMGISQGGSGSFSGLMAAAGGASLEDRVGFETKQMRTMGDTADMDRLQSVQMDRTLEQMKMLGLKVTHDTLSGTFKGMWGATMGETEAAVTAYEQPWLKERTRIASFARTARSQRENDMQATGLSQWWEGYKEQAGAAYQYLWSGKLDRSKYMLRSDMTFDPVTGQEVDRSRYWQTGRSQDALSDVWDGRNLFGGEEELTPTRNGSIKGIARSFWSSQASVFGRAWDNIWDSWELAPAGEGGIRFGFGGTKGRGTSREQYLQKADIQKMGNIGLAQADRDAAVIAFEAKEKWGAFTKGAANAISWSREEIMNQAWNKAGITAREEVYRFQEQLGEQTDMSFSEADTLSLISNSILLRRDIAGKKGDARAAVIKRGMELLRREEKYKDLDDKRLSQIVEAQVRFSGTNDLLDEPTQLKLQRSMSAEAIKRSFETVTGNDAAWEDFSSKTFKDPNGALASEIRTLGKTGKLDRASLSNMLTAGAIRGDLRKGMTGGAAVTEFYMSGAEGTTEGTSREDLPSEGKAGELVDAQIKALVASEGSLVAAIQLLVERMKKNP